VLCAVCAIVVTSGATPVLAFSTYGGGATCAPAAGLNLAIGEPPQPGPPGSVDASGNLTLYCRGPATNSRAGQYGPGQPVTPPKLGALCSVGADWEVAQGLSQPSEESGWEGGPAYVKVFPIAFWSGSVGAIFQVESPHFFSGDVSDTTQTALDANWTATSQYGPPPPSIKPGSGLATAAMITSGLQDQRVTVDITTEIQGTWGLGGDGNLVCDGPTLDVTPAIIPDDDGPPSDTPPVEPTWGPPTLQQAMASAGVSAGQVQASAPDNYVVFAPTTFWISPQPQGPDVPPVVINVMGDPDADGESIVFTYYLDVAPSDTINWDFGDGTTGTSQAEGSGPGEAGVTHYYKQISGEGSVPAAGPTVTATQDVTVTAFVAWVDGIGGAFYECVTPDGGVDGVNQKTQAGAVAACSTTYANALVDGALPPKPVYQVRTIPVA
jgi:hypothetical protein